MARIELSNIGGGGTTLSLTTTGTSGASTLAGSVLNIPIYQGQLTLTTTGTSGAATLVGDTLNIPNYATGGNPAGSAGQVQFNSTPSGSFAASANLAWDNTAVQLNINTPLSPTGKLNVKGSGATSSTVNTRLTDSGNTELLKVLDNGSTNIGANFNWDNVNGRLGLGTSTPNQTLEVSGAMRLTGTAGTAAFMLGRNSAGDVSTVTLGTTGTSGAATLSANVLNIPQYQGALTLSTAGTTGASTLVGNTLTIPTYQGQISLTTTGTSGASTFVGNTLNIPTYQGQITLTTTGTSGAATLVGNTLNIPQYSGGGGTPAGSTGQIQFNNSGAFGASASLAWDNASTKLNVGAPSFVSGVLNVKSGSSLLTTIHSQFTNSGNADVMNLFNGGRVIFGATTFNDPSSVITGFGNRISVASASNYQDFQFVNTNIASGNINSYSFGQRRDTFFGNQLGSFQIVGSYTDNSGVGFPVGGNYRVPLICNPDGTVIISGAANSTNGNVSVGTTSSIANFGVRGSNASSGTNALLVQNSNSDDIYKIENNGKISYFATNTAAGTTGAQTINRPSGTVNFAAGATALVVTNSLCTTASIVLPVIRTNDATATIKNVVPSTGSFTINLSAAATAETSVGFFIIN